MKYSFIIPTYNSGQWIQSCVQSILMQTYPAFNILIVDSGSTDGTLEWINSIKDHRINIYTTSSRLDIVENWQRFTTIPKNEFMTILGHDDILYPHYLETINRLIEQFPGAGLYQTNFNFIDGNGELIRSCTPMKANISPEALLESILQNRIEITATGFMVRSKDYDAIGGIPPYPKLLYADLELWLRLILKSYLAVAPEHCFAFRLHLTNTSKSVGEFKLRAFDMLIDFFCTLKNDNPIYSQVIETNAAAFLKNHVVGSCNKLLYADKLNRNNVTMDRIIEASEKSAQKLVPSFIFRPAHYPGIWLAKSIDSIPLLRKLFLYYKSFQKRAF